MYKRQELKRANKEFKAELAKTNEQIQNNREESRAEFKEFKEQLTTKLEEINTRIAAVKITIETKQYEQTIVIENKREQTFIITDNNSNAIINTRGERKIKIKQSYLIDRGIQVARYTQYEICLLYTSEINLFQQAKNTCSIEMCIRDRSYVMYRCINFGAPRSWGSTT